MQGVRCWVIVVGCWVVMKSGCLGMEVGLWMFGVEAPHMLCERPAHVVRMVSTNGVEGLNKLLSVMKPNATNGLYNR